jgi:hypothetical protein
MVDMALRSGRLGRANRRGRLEYRLVRDLARLPFTVVQRICKDGLPNLPAWLQSA